MVMQAQAGRPMIPMEQVGGSFMATVANDAGEEGSVYYAENMLPLDTDNPQSPWASVGFWQNQGTGTAGGSAVVAHGSLPLVSGTVVNWQLSTTSGLWTVDGAGTYTNVVTSGNFTTAGITLTASTVYYTVVFNGTLIVTDQSGTQVPWRWDGTSGAASLTELTSAPVAYGRPTIYYAKLFFIKNSQRNTIVWSEENDPTSGYEAGGFSNAWALTQSTNENLIAIEGGNEGLYYARRNSIGVIRGAVTDTFQTDGTHDGVAQFGTGVLGGLMIDGNDLWVWTGNSLKVVPAGGAARTVWTHSDQYGTPAVDGGVGVSVWSVSDDGRGQMIVIPPGGSTGGVNYPTLWLPLARTAGTDYLCLIVDMAHYRPLGWIVQGDSGSIQLRWLSTYNSGGVVIRPAFTDYTTGRVMVHTMTFQAASDRNASGTAKETQYALVGRSLTVGSGEIMDYQFDRLDFSASAQAGSNGQWSVLASALTSRQDRTPSPGQSQTLSTVTAPAEIMDPGRFSVGMNQSGRWIRPVFISAVTSTTGFSGGGMRLYGWTVWAYPLGGGPKVP